jgi:hypothetical protein
MAKIDLITLSGLTAIDGGIIASGATVKFDSEFIAGSTDIIIKPKIFRSRELFESGFREIKSLEMPNDFRITLVESDYYTLTPAILYEKVRDYLNQLLGGDMFEINVIL